MAQRNLEEEEEEENIPKIKQQHGPKTETCNYVFRTKTWRQLSMAGTWETEDGVGKIYQNKTRLWWT